MAGDSGKDKGKGKMTVAPKSKRQRTGDRELDRALRAAEVDPRRTTGGPVLGRPQEEQQGLRRSARTRTAQQQTPGSQRVPSRTAPQETSSSSSSSSEADSDAPFFTGSQFTPEEMSQKKDQALRAMARVAGLPPLLQGDLLGVDSKTMRSFREVPESSWAPLQRDPAAGPRYWTVLQRRIADALGRKEALHKGKGSIFAEQQHQSVELLSRAAGVDFRPHLTFIPGLLELLTTQLRWRRSTVLEFYSSLWVAEDRSAIWFLYNGSPQRLTAGEIREALDLPEVDSELHTLAHPEMRPPRRPQGGTEPPAHYLARLFSGEVPADVSRGTASLTQEANVLRRMLVRTLVPRSGYLDRISITLQWAMSLFLAHEQFDVVDAILCQFQDVLAERIGYRQLAFGPLICLILLRTRVMTLEQYDAQPETTTLYTPLPASDRRVLRRGIASQGSSSGAAAATAGAATELHQSPVVQSEEETRVGPSEEEAPASRAPPTQTVSSAPTDPVISAQLAELTRRLEEQDRWRAQQEQRDATHLDLTRQIADSLRATQASNEQLAQGMMAGFGLFTSVLQQLGQVFPGLPAVPQAFQLAQPPQQQQQPLFTAGTFSTLLSAPQSPSGPFTLAPGSSTFAGLTGAAGPSSRPLLSPFLSPGAFMTPSALFASTSPALPLQSPSTAVAVTSSPLPPRTLVFDETVTANTSLSPSEFAAMTEFGYTSEELAHLTEGQSTAAEGTSTAAETAAPETTQTEQQQGPPPESSSAAAARSPAPDA